MWTQLSLSLTIAIPWQSDTLYFSKVCQNCYSQAEKAGVHGPAQSSKRTKNDDRGKDKKSTSVDPIIDAYMYGQVLEQVLVTNDKLEKENKDLKEENEKLWKQSAEVFQMRRPARLENVTDPKLQTITLVHDLDHLYQAEWCELWEEGENVEDDCDTIARLSGMMQTINTKCTDTSKLQINCFLGLGEEDATPKRNEVPEIYYLRRKVNIPEEKRAKFIKKLVEPLVDKSFQNFSKDPDNDTEFKETFRLFWEKFADICWLLTMAEDDIEMVFNVVGKHFDEVKPFFNQYVTKEPLNRSEEKKHTVNTLVWPCVRKTSWEILAKGEVLLVT